MSLAGALRKEAMQRHVEINCIRFGTFFLSRQFSLDLVEDKIVYEAYLEYHIFSG